MGMMILIPMMMMMWDSGWWKKSSTSGGSRQLFQDSWRQLSQFDVARRGHYFPAQRTETGPTSVSESVLNWNWLALNPWVYMWCDGAAKTRDGEVLVRFLLSNDLAQGQARSELYVYKVLKVVVSEVCWLTKTISRRHIDKTIRFSLCLCDTSAVFEIDVANTRVVP